MAILPESPLRFAYQRSSSRVAHDTRYGDKSSRGSPSKRCFDCSKSDRLTKETIHNGLLLLRVRYGLPYSELPDCSPSELSRFLSFLLLQGKERTSVAFPRRQRRGINGLCNLQRLGRKERWALAHSVSSIKRNLPSGCRRHTPSVRQQWEANVLSQPPPPSSEYLAHVRRVAAQVFRPGWDRRYRDFVGRFTPNPTARACKGRADHLWSGRREEFLTLTTSEAGQAPSVFTARYKEVMSAGKCRPLLIYDEFNDLLAPLHSTMYSYLCQQDWLLCGPPTEKRMASVCVNSVQTSVDLVAATDGLSHSVAEELLDVAFWNSQYVPRRLRLLAKSSLSPLFVSRSGSVERVRHGQMMGAYLSFPLLCLQSYCAATWAARNDEGARFLVNGDDCVISAGRAITVQDYPQGYRLNDDKTIRAGNVAEINSTCFLLSRGRWREVCHLRRGGAPSDFPGMMHMAKAVCISPAMVDAYQRCRIGRRWGFLPSQLNHYGYPAHLREQGLRTTRTWSPLPEPVYDSEFAEELVRISGRDPTPVEAEALRVAFWKHGRMGGLKRDVFSPSCGKVRRTYTYRKIPIRSRLSYVGRGRPKLCALGVKAPDSFLVPASWISEEEQRGLAEYDLFRSCWDSGYIDLSSLGSEG